MAGFRSPSVPLGISAPAVVAQAGVGLLAFWMGGARAAGAPVQAGFKSLLGFWGGGCGSGAFVPPVPVPVPGMPGGVGGGMGGYAWGDRYPTLRPKKPGIEYDLVEEEELILIIAAVINIISRR